MKIYNAATNALVGTVTFQSRFHNIELTVHNKPVELASRGMFTSAHQFMSSATHGSFKRKNDGMLGGGDMLCLDDWEQQVARSEGKFELRSEVEGLLMDELVVSGIVMVEARRRKNSGSAGASGGGGGGGY